LQAKLDTSITAFELIHKQSYNFLSEVCPDVKIPFDKHPEWSILIELSGGMGSNLESRLFEGLEDLFKEGLVSDALIAQSEKQAKEFWDLRENIPEANRRIGSISNHDISLPISLIPKFIQEMPTYMAHLADLRINCFGHLGDGNLHYNVFPPLGKNKNDYVHLREEIKTIIHDKINEFGGSVSAEHGIGRLKIDDLEKYGDPVKLIAMRSIKNAIDPKGIMNPGAVLRESK